MTKLEKALELLKKCMAGNYTKEEIKSFLENENPLENENILPTNIKNVIKKLVKSNPDLIFGGSICLNALGLIKREIRDIDIFIAEGLGITTQIEQFTKLEEEDFSETITDIDGKPIKRIGFKVDGVKICCFQTENNELMNSSKFSFDGITINLQNVNYAIQAKRLYADKTDKHKNDLKQIEETLNDLPF